MSEKLVENILKNENSLDKNASAVAIVVSNWNDNKLSFYR